MTQKFTAENFEDAIRNRLLKSRTRDEEARNVTFTDLINDLNGQVLPKIHFEAAQLVLKEIFIFMAENTPTFVDKKPISKEHTDREGNTIVEVVMESFVETPEFREMFDDIRSKILAPATHNIKASSISKILELATKNTTRDIKVEIPKELLVEDNVIVVNPLTYRTWFDYLIKTLRCKVE